MDWAPEYARSNTRAEQTHVLAAMIQLFETGIMYCIQLITLELSTISMNARKTLTQ
jgi:hypothetical protein